MRGPKLYIVDEFRLFIGNSTQLSKPRKMKLQAFPRALLWLTLGYSCLAQAQNGPAYQDPSIAESTARSENHTTLLAAVVAAELEDTLSYDGPFTVFAPSDAAFENWSSEKVSALLKPENRKELQSLITYHMVAGKFTASRILRELCRGEGKASFTTVQGKEIRASMEGINIVLTDEFGNAARITVADSNQCNGVIHEIDRVILPKKM